MNRKVATLILLVVVALSVVIVSVFFSEPLDQIKTVPVTGIYITDTLKGQPTPIDTPEEIEYGMVIIDVSDLEAGVNTVTFFYTIAPETATNQAVDFILEEGDKEYARVTGGGGSATITFTQRHPNGGVDTHGGIIVTIKCLDGSGEHVSICFIRNASSGSTDL